MLSAISALVITAATAAAEPKFEPQTLDASVAIGYGLAIGDGKLDVIAAGRDSHNLIVYWNAR